MYQPLYSGAKAIIELREVLQMPGLIQQNNSDEVPN